MKLTKAQRQFIKELSEKKTLNNRNPYDRVANNLQKMSLVEFSFVAGWYLTSEGLSEVKNAH